MSIPDDPIPPAKKIRTSTSQQPLETSRDSSLLPSKETEIFLFGVYMTPGKKSRTNMRQEPRVMSPKNTDEEDLKKKTDDCSLEKEEEERYGVSTEPTLFITDPWIIKKELNENELLGYLYLSEDVVESHILRHLSEDDQKNKLRQGDGMTVNVYDHDTHTTHEMLLIRSKTKQDHYRLKNFWLSDFVDRRGLKIGDEIGLFWDSNLHFRVLLVH